MLNGIKASWTHAWGFWIFSISSIISFIQLLNPRHWGHYKIFSGAALALWHGLTPFGQDFGSNVGYWFYSLSCGLFFYGPFAALPMGFGLFAYMLFGFFLFLGGTIYFLKVARRAAQYRIVPEKFYNWVWLWLSFFVMSAILADKLELAMLGLFLFATAWLIEGRWLGASAFLLGMMINWKFQPLPIVGLLICVLVTLDFKRALKFCAYTCASIIFWFAAPLPILGYSKVVSFSKEWSATLREQVERDWSRFQHVFKMPMYLFNWSPTLDGLQHFALLCGIVLAVIVLLWMKRATRVLTGKDFFQLKLWGFSLALALGCWFILALSPMSETNAFILAAPLFLAAGLLREKVSEAQQKLLKRQLSFGIHGAGILIGFLCSDVFGKTSRIFFTDLGIRPYGATFLALILVVSLFQYLKIVDMK